MFDLPEDSSPDDMIGRIVAMEVTGSGPLVLKGCVKSPIP